MSLYTKLFPCRGCEAKDAELARTGETMRWLEEQIDLQNRRLVEIADPRANERVVQAARLDRKPDTPPARVAPYDGLRLPGTEPSPEPGWEVDQES